MLFVAIGGGAFAAQLDAPTLSWVESGFGRVDLTVTAGPSGTPGGFTLWWMKRADFEANGGQWYEYGNPAQGDAYFVGAPSLNNFPGEPGTFLLGPNESITIQPGDIADETGVVSYSLDELEYGMDYVYCVFANAATGWEQSGYSKNSSATTNGADANCTFTQGYWKNHEDEWPVSALTLGSVSYTAAQLLAILQQPVQGNGLISLAHQLIATKLNLAMGADPTDVAAAVVAADALIGALVVPPVGGGFIAPSTTSAVTEILDDFNNGIIGPGHCDDPAACCFADGSCQTIPPEDCTAAGGTPQGGGTTCDTVTCTPPPPRGACCTPAYICVDGVTQAECEALAGTFYPDALCSEVVCVNATESKSWGNIKGLYR